MSCSNTAKVATGRLWQKGAAKSLSMCRRCSKWRASIWPFIATDSLNDLTPVCPGPLVSRISMKWLRTCQRGLINLFLHLEAFSFEVMLPRQQHSHQLPAWKRPRMLKTLFRWASWSTMRIKHLGAKATSLYATPEGKDKHKEMRTKTTIKKKYKQAPTNTDKTNMNNNQQTKTTYINKKTYHHGLRPHFLWSDNFIPAFSRFSYQGAMRTGRTYRAWWAPESAPEFTNPFVEWAGYNLSLRIVLGTLFAKNLRAIFSLAPREFDVEAYDF